MILSHWNDINATNELGYTFLHRVCDNHNIIERLVNAGANGISQNTYGETPLHILVKHNIAGVNIIHCLTSISNPNLVDKYGRTTFIVYCANH